METIVREHLRVGETLPHSLGLEKADTSPQITSQA